MPRRHKSKNDTKLIRKIAKSVVAKNTETKVAIVKFTQVQLGYGSAGAVVNAFNDIPQGTGQAERLGNQVTLTSIKWDMFFAGADTTNAYRMIVYIPKSPGNLITALPFNGAVDYDQFTVLKDIFRTTSLNGNNAFRLNGYHSFRNKGKCVGMKTQWSGITANSQTKNRVLLYITTDSTAVPNPELNGYIRCFYKDA